jgi:hypothetical protein
VPHDGRHGVARHHAPQQHLLLRTGHRLSSSICSTSRTPELSGSRVIGLSNPDHGPDHETVLAL